MNPQELVQSEASGAHAVRNPLSAMQPGEQTICAIKRHPIGMFGVYVGTGLLLIVAAVLAFIVAPSLITSVSRTQVMAGGGLAFVVLAALCLGFVFVANKVYWGNGWVVTSDSVTQITQTSLFDKRSSQLSLGSLEDVTAEQNGILPHMLNYGSIRVETAGERGKFVFLYCPNPNYYAQQILSARERFEQGRTGEGLQRPYRAEGAYSAQPGSQPQPVPLPDAQAAAPAVDPGYGAYAPPPPIPSAPSTPYPENPLGPDATSGPA
ncbi:MAG TPA: PH domain-containing protein [Verrucomicrobiae bacterium]|jgi:hypothetical protein|nr:PH domain-containing protein [Verrucomicrobiae bacterium]